MKFKEKLKFSLFKLKEFSFINLGHFGPAVVMNSSRNLFISILCFKIYSFVTAFLPRIDK